MTEKKGMFNSNGRTWLVAAVLNSTALVLGKRLRPPDWVRLGTPAGIEGYKAMLCAGIGSPASDL